MFMMESVCVCVQCERELAEQQEKNTRLQTRLTQAEHRASTTSQQVHTLSHSLTLAHTS